MSQLQFLIAGAGIAGLSAALALRRAGHACQIFEKSCTLSEVGAGIQLGANATRILNQWGVLEPLLTQGFEPQQLIVRDAALDRVITQRRMDDARQRYGAPHVCIRRADLQNILLKAVQTAGIPVHLGQAVQAGAKPTDHPSTTDTQPPWDALIGCDGLWSNVRACLIAAMPYPQARQHDLLQAPHPTGHTAFRAMIASKHLPQALSLPAVQIWMGKRQHVVVYPVNHNLINVVVLQEDQTTLEAVLPSVSPLLRALIDAVQTHVGWTTWPLFYRPPRFAPDIYAQGNMALLGDAVHPMLPYLAQGAAMAIEDAHALGIASRACPKEQLEKALQQYAQQRYRRNAQVQRRSMRQGQIYHASGFMRLARDGVLALWGQHITQAAWLYGYRVEDDARAI